ncbi:MAG: hypothetical protein HFI85_02410 [Clostridia bacterium]|jgi:hypothetical protein|nr:hypothetical protein [Clostridia bacterium]
MKKNPYFIDGNLGLNDKQVALAKQNNYYLFKALNQIYKTARDNDAKIGGALRAALLGGELKNSDSATGVDTNGLGGKLKFLTISLSDPKKLEQFKNSFFYNNILKALAAGAILDDNKTWPNYKHTSNYEQTFKNKSSVEAAIVCQREDLKAPLGLDYSKLIDSIVKTDENGNYYLEDSYTVEEEIAMDEAISTQIKSLKNNERFKRNYYNPKEKEAELDDEDILE